MAFKYVSEQLDTQIESTIQLKNGQLEVMFDYEVSLYSYRPAKITAFPDTSYPEEFDFEWGLAKPFYISKDGLYWYETECDRILELIFDQCCDEVLKHYES